MAAQWTRDGVLFTQNELNRMGVTDPANLNFVMVEDIVPVHDSFKVKMVKTGELKDGKFVYVEVPLTDDETKEVIKKYAKSLLECVDRYISYAVEEMKGYDSVDAIGKYLVVESPFYAECREISLWISNCYVKCSEIENNVLNKTQSIPTAEEVISSLPVPTFLSEDEFNNLTVSWGEIAKDCSEYNSVPVLN